LGGDRGEMGRGEGGEVQQGGTGGGWVGGHHPLGGKGGHGAKHLAVRALGLKAGRAGHEGGGMPRVPSLGELRGRVAKRRAPAAILDRCCARAKRSAAESHSCYSTRWSTSLSSKVNLPLEINFSDVCGENLVAWHPIIWSERGTRTPSVYVFVCGVWYVNHEAASLQEKCWNSFRRVLCGLEGNQLEVCGDLESILKRKEKEKTCKGSG